MTPSENGMVAVMRAYASEYAEELAEQRTERSAAPARGASSEGPPRMAWIGVARVSPTGRTVWGR